CTYLNNMKQKLLFACIIFCALGCGHTKPVPVVSAIKVSLEEERFEKVFFFNILGSSPDSAAKNVPAFIRSYEGMNKAAERQFKDFKTVEDEVRGGLQFVHYYFPGYKLPVKLITFIGPINSYGNIITSDALAVGLQLYMGRDYPM